MGSESQEVEGRVTHENELIAESENNGSAALLDNIKQRQRELAPLGRTKILEVPGYQGKLGIEYQYISSEVTEKIAKKIQRELRGVGGQGEMLLGAMDTLIAACKRLVIRKDTASEWQSLPGPGGDVQLDSKLSQILDFPASEPREVVLGLFGSEHAIVQQNVLVSRWLTDTSREVDEDFFG